MADQPKLALSFRWRAETGTERGTEPGDPPVPLATLTPLEGHRYCEGRFDLTLRWKKASEAGGAERWRWIRARWAGWSPNRWRRSKATTARIARSAMSARSSR